MSEQFDEFELTPIRLEVKRQLSQKNCHWFPKDLVLVKGAIVYAYGGYTYQCISKSGVAVTLEPDKEPFFEVPKNAVKRVASS